jgi:ferrous iron transport protein B
MSVCQPPESLSSVSNMVNASHGCSAGGPAGGTCDAAQHQTPNQALKPANTTELIDWPPHLKTVVLAGNPNVGKSVVFNALTGQYANVSNFPGTTVDMSVGQLQQYPQVVVKDTPGIYGLSGLSEEETIAQQVLDEADVVLNVVSAITLDRDLFFTQQLIDYGYTLILAVNQMDEATALGLTLDLPTLAKRLGIPVLPTVATQSQGLQAVVNQLPNACKGHGTPECPVGQVRQLESNTGSRLMVYGQRRQHLKGVLSGIVSAQQAVVWHKQVADNIGQGLLHPVLGLLAGLVVMALLYQIIGVWVAGDVVNFTEKHLMLDGVVPWIKHAVGLVVPANTILSTILVGEFGVLTLSVQYIFGVLFPLVLGFYLYMALLEDCGYLPRIAVLADGLLNRIGLNGRAVIPLILGFGCVTMATVSTRVLTSQRERTIASTLLAITIPCSAQIGVIAGLMALAGGLTAWLIYLAVLGAILLTIGSVLNKLLPGRSGGLLLDLPPMRLPMWRNIWTKTWVRTKIFLWEAAPLFILGSLLVSVVQAFGWLTTIQGWLAPITVAWLKLPAETANAFIMGMVRRDFGAAGMYFLAPQMTPTQILTSLLVITLFVPCIASATVMTKERGWVEGITVLLSSWVLAFLVGGLFARLMAFSLF